MKKILSMTLSLFISASILVGCSNTTTKEENAIENTSVSIGAPDGLPAIAISKLAGEKHQIKDNYEVKYILEGTSDALSTDVMKEALDLAIVPSNMAAVAYNKTSNYKILGTVGMGSFYLVSSDSSVTGLDSSLSGKEVGAIGKGLTPDITVRSLLKEQGVDSSTVIFNYSNEASDLVTLLATNKLTTGIVPEPALTGLLSKNSDLKVVCSLNDTWKSVFKNENGYPQSTLIVKSSFAEKNTEFINNFIKIIAENTDWINKNPKEAGEFAEEFGVTVQKDVLQKAIDRTNLKFISISECKNDYINYYEKLFNFNPKVLGGSVPEEDIYYTK